MVSSYAMFVKEHIHQFKHLPAKQRMKAVAELYKKNKSGMSEAPAKKGKGRPKKGGSFLDMLGLGLEDKKGGAMTAGKLVRKKKGGSLLGSIIPFGNLMGLGLEDKKGGVMTAAGLHKKRGRPKKGGAMTAAGLDESGGSLLGSIIPFGNLLGLGLEDKKGGVMTAAGLHKKRGRPKKGGAMTAAGLDESGGSLLGSIIPFGNLLGLGLQHKKRGRKAKGGAMTAGALPMAHSVSPLHAGSFGDWFFKGLTAPFALASKIPLPGLQQIGEAGTKAFNAIGAPTLF